MDHLKLFEDALEAATVRAQFAAEEARRFSRELDAFTPGTAAASRMQELRAVAQERFEDEVDARQRLNRARRCSPGELYCKLPHSEVCVFHG